MKKILLISLLAFVCAFSNQKKTKVIFFGDSITQAGVNPDGYISRIENMCRGEGKQDLFEFVGAGISGHKIYDLYLRMEEDVLAKNPDIVIIYIGVNDVWHKALSGTGTDQDRFEKFYLAIIKKLKEKNIKVIVCTPAVIGEKTDYSNPQDGDLNQYSIIIRNIASKNVLPLVDLRKAFLAYNQKNNSENKDRGILTTDRVHLNAQGNQLVADLLWEELKKTN
ncbi:MAG TPA: SGNH/GDSL hydrolase family protein [Chitinophagaceae bacterium]|nr:SGNH/GDSL hydrolase family protein [Chitinophagaceae bacterium]